MIKDYFRVYPTDIDFHAKISKNTESNPFDKDDPRYSEWIKAFNEYHKIAQSNTNDCCG